MSREGGSSYRGEVLLLPVGLGSCKGGEGWVRGDGGSARSNAGLLCRGVWVTPGAPARASRLAG